MNRKNKEEVILSVVELVKISFNVIIRDYGKFVITVL